MRNKKYNGSYFYGSSLCNVTKIIFLILFSGFLINACEGGDYPYFIKENAGGSLDSLRWDIPCASSSAGTDCVADNPDPVSAIFEGIGGGLYSVTLRFRGVVEQKTYIGGENDGAYWQIGGAPDNDVWNIYKLEVSSPYQVYYLNRGVSLQSRCFGIDYTATIKISHGATVRLTADVIDSSEATNKDGAGNPILIPGVPPYPDAYDGQFIQMNIVSAKLIE